MQLLHQNGTQKYERNVSNYGSFNYITLIHGIQKYFGMFFVINLRSINKDTP